VITPPPKKPPTSGQRKAVDLSDIPAVGEGTIADMLRDAADVLDGKAE
jgi:hypothetical protein